MVNVWGRAEILQGLLGIPENKSPLGIPRRRWELNLKWIWKEKNGGLN
jgi:hypothetical protein